MISTLRRLICGLLLIAAVGCSTSTDPSIQMGAIEIQLTDAPTDNSDVVGVFVTLTDVKIDGASVAEFSKQTVDLNALRDGKTQVVAKATMIAKRYNAITLVIDTNVDASGATPGSYVQTADNSKYALGDGGLREITIKKPWVVPSNASATLVVDFDLRKAVKSSNDPTVKYAFVSDENLRSAIRVTTRETSGTIKGMYAEKSPTGADKVIVYAYKKGTFDAIAETQGQTDDAIYFRNASASAEVDYEGLGSTYTLHFLEAGDYDVHFAAYRKDPSSNEFTFSGMLKAITSSKPDTGETITVQPGLPTNAWSAIQGQ